MISLQAVVARKRGPPVPVLDLLSASNYSAYSTRLMRAAYTGKSLRVRRSSDNTEQDIGFLTNGNLDTAALTTFVGANSAYVVTWYDQTGNGVNITQASSSLQPRLVNAGSIEMSNGRPAPYFNNTLLMSGSFGSATQPFTRNYVCQNNSSSGPSNYAFIFSSQNQAPYSPAYMYNANEMRLYAGGTETAIGTVGSTEGAVWTAQYNNMSSFGRKNGVAGSTGAAGTNGFDGGIMGMYDTTNYPYTGWVSEATVFYAPLNTSQSQILERNQGAYYGISVA